MTVVYLITHAHTAVDPSRDAAHWHLSPAGEDQAEALAQQPCWDHVDVIALSSEPKTRLTVAPVLAARKLPLVVDPRFDELKRSGWADDYAALVKQAFAEPEVAVDGWEAAASAQARFLAGMDALAAAHPGGTLALVSHGLVLSLYRAHILGLSHVRLADWQQLSFAAVATVEISAATGRCVLVQDFAAVAGHQPRG
jgi:broad specificity phosphatase PhoE